MWEILFKAKRIDNGEWVEGYYVKTGEASYIVVPYSQADISGAEGSNIEVDANTICQYTGLTDKNCNKIWENDVCQYTEEDKYGIRMDLFVVRYGRKVELSKIDIGFFADWIKNSYFRRDLGFWVENRNIEVIGNIFDNPELLEGGAE